MRRLNFLVIKNNHQYWHCKFASQRGWEISLNILITCLPFTPPQVCTHVASYNTQMMPCSPRPLYLTARKLNVKYLPSPWYVTPQIPAVMGSSHIPPTGSLSSLLFSLFSHLLPAPTALLNLTSVGPPTPAAKAWTCHRHQAFQGKTFLQPTYLPHY